MEDLGNIKHAIVKAALELAAADWNNGGETYEQVAHRDFTQDRFEEELDRYYKVRAGQEAAATT